MPLFLVDHLEGCTPLEPCPSCQAASFLRSKLDADSFEKLIKLVKGNVRPVVAAPLDASIETLNLSARAFNCLRNDNIQTIGDLVARSGQELLRISNLGRVSLQEIKEALAEIGHQLRPHNLSL